MKLDDFPRLADFLVRCLDEEAPGGLKLRRNQAGTPDASRHGAGKSRFSVLTQRRS